MTNQEKQPLNWEETFDKVAVSFEEWKKYNATVNWDAIKSFIRTTISQAVKEAELKMGVSQWMNYGEKYGYDKFWKEKILKDERERIAKGICIPNNCPNLDCPTIGRMHPGMCPCRIMAQQDLDKALSDIRN